VERPSIPLANELMRTCDLTIATGGPAMVKSAYSSGKPAYGVGAGNATMVVDETADIMRAARNVAISKTNDHGSGCSADGNVLVDASIYDAFLEQLQAEGGYVVNAAEKELLEQAYWDADGHRTANTIARAASVVAGVAGFSIGIISGARISTRCVPNGFLPSSARRCPRTASSSQTSAGTRTASGSSFRSRCRGRSLRRAAWRQWGSGPPRYWA
jgi:hypothetical protein